MRDVAFYLCVLCLPFLGSTATAVEAGKSDDKATSPGRRADAFFGVHFDLHPNAADTVLGKNASAGNIAEFLDSVRPDFVQYDCKGHPGYTGYPTEVGYASPGIVNDALRLWRDETKKRNIGLYVHYSGILDAAAIKHHPEWARVDADGNADPEVVSLFSDYPSQLMIPQLKEVCGQYELDGVWVDGDCWGVKLDYGTTAVAQWKQATGYDVVPLKPEDPHWQEWKHFHRSAFEKYLERWVDELHGFSQDLELCSNWAYTPHMPVPIEADVDFLSGDFSAKESVDRARFEARYLDSTGMPWDLMAWGFNGYSDSPGAVPQHKHAEQLKQEASVVLALGGGVQVYYQPTRAGYIPRHITETVRQVSQFCRDRQSLSHKSKSVPQVALLLSTSSYLTRSNNVYSPHGLYNALEGALHVLLESGYSVDLLSEHQLQPRMEEYPVIVIAQASVLEPGFRDKLVAYIENGGSLILLDQESCEPFREVLGVEYAGDPVQVNAYVADHSSIAPVPGLWQTVETTAAEVLANRYGRDWPGPGATAEAPGAGADTAATSTTLGAGSIVAVYGPASQAYFDTHNPVLRNWINDLVSRSFRSPKARVVDNPNVDMSLRKTADGREVIHLVNLSGAQRAGRFAAIDKLPPSGQVTVDWELPKPPKSVAMFPGNVAIPFDGQPDAGGNFRVRLKVDNVDLHSILVPQF